VRAKCPSVKAIRMRRLDEGATTDVFVARRVASFVNYKMISRAEIDRARDRNITDDVKKKLSNEKNTPCLSAHKDIFKF
jgi:hypothetical protein